MTFAVPKRRPPRFSRHPPSPFPSVSYNPPEWGAPPLPSTLSFIVIRAGVQLQTIHLEVTKRSYLVLGRAPDADIPVAHASVSRYHVVLQFHQTVDEGQQAALYLFDLNSTHGTFVNDKPIPNRKLVPVFDGDFIRFGESTRRYIVKHQLETHGDIANDVDRATDKTQVDEDHLRENEDKREVRNEVLWGMDDIVEEPREGEELSVEMLPVDFENLTQGQRKQWKKLEKMRETLQNLLNERERIQAKEINGLTEGQKSRLGLLEEKIATLSEQVEEAELRLQTDQTMANVRQKEDQSKLLEFGAAEDAGGEEDTLWDESDGSGSKFKIASVETEGSLRKKLAALQRKLGEAKESFSAIEKRNTSGAPFEYAGDSLDAFMNENDAALKQEAVNKARRRVAQLEDDALAIKTLLHKVTDTGSDKIEPSEPLRRKLKASNPSKPVVPFEKRDDSINASVKGPLARRFPSNTVERQHEGHGGDPGSGRKNHQEDLPQKRKAPAGPVTSRPPIELVRPRQRSGQDEYAEEGPSEIWEPPSGQTGDGRTRLNDKYGY